MTKHTITPGILNLSDQRTPADRNMERCGFQDHTICMAQGQERGTKLMHQILTALGVTDEKAEVFISTDVMDKEPPKEGLVRAVGLVCQHKLCLWSMT